MTYQEKSNISNAPSLSDSIRGRHGEAQELMHIRIRTSDHSLKQLCRRTPGFVLKGKKTALMMANLLHDGVLDGEYLYMRDSQEGDVKIPLVTILSEPNTYLAKTFIPKTVFNRKHLDAVGKKVTVTFEINTG